MNFLESFREPVDPQSMTDKPSPINLYEHYNEASNTLFENLTFIKQA